MPSQPAPVAVASPQVLEQPLAPKPSPPAPQPLDPDPPEGFFARLYNAAVYAADSLSRVTYYPSSGKVSLAHANGQQELVDSAEEAIEILSEVGEQEQVAMVGAFT